METLILDTRRWPDEIVGELTGMPATKKNKNLYNSTGDQAEKLKKNSHPQKIGIRFSLGEAKFSLPSVLKGIKNSSIKNRFKM